MILIALGWEITFGIVTILGFFLSLGVFYITKRTKKFIMQNAIFESMETEGINEIFELQAVLDNINLDKFDGAIITSLLIPILSKLSYYNAVLNFCQKSHIYKLLKFCRIKEYNKNKVIFELGIIIGFLQATLKKKNLVNNKKVGL